MSMLNHFFDYKPEVLALDEKALELCQSSEIFSSGIRAAA